MYTIIILVRQKKYKFGNKKLNYIFKRKVNSKSLLIIFNSFPGKENKAKYNYMRTLKNVKENKIFLLDDFGYEKQGSYFLGENGNLFLPEMIKNLINKITKKYRINNIITIGTSKGGTAAIYYGILFNAKRIICGSPQYYIAKYLNEDEYKRNLLNGITGGIIENEDLDQILKNEIKINRKNNIRIHILYSSNEKGYKIHLKDLLSDLKENKFVVDECDMKYKEHNDVAKFFPEFCKNIFKEGSY